MNTLLGRLSAAGAIFAGSATSLLAQSYGSCWWYCTPTPPRSVPEIDATTGVLAVAAVLAVLAFTWERRRRTM
jgi:hypothetical protein